MTNFPFRRISAWQVLLLSLLWAWISPDRTWAEDGAGNSAFLFFTHWSAAAYSEKAAGTVCWIDGPDGSLRVEVLRNDRAGKKAASDLSPLLNRTGDGWTLVVGPDQIGTLNAWGNQWREVPVGLAQLVRLATASLPSYPVPPPRFPFAARVRTHRRTAGIVRPRILETSPPDGERAETWRYQLAPLTLENDRKSAVPSFRRKMTARGRGTGGVGEILTMQWDPASDRGGFDLSLHSSRRPGTLHLEAAGRLAVAAPEPEVFLPLWPLSEFFQAR